MSNSTTETQFEATPETMKTLEDFVREGARRMLQAALEAEVGDFVESFKNLVDGDGKRLVVRNGTMPQRAVLTGAGISTAPPEVRSSMRLPGLAVGATMRRRCSSER